MPDAHKAYCVRCKAMKEIVEPAATLMGNGAVMLKGTCPTCKSKITGFVAAAKWTGATPKKAAPKKK